MTPFLLYLVKVILCSALFSGYYWLVLRNNRFHQWNRYYLLITTLLAVIIPLLHLPASAEGSDGLLAYTGQVLEARDQWLPAVTVSAGGSWSYADWIPVLYAAPVLLLLLRLGAGLRKMLILLSGKQKEVFPDYTVIYTRDEKSPYSFFRYLFWNEAIDAASPEGRQMLRHERVHIRQKHSADKLLMEVLCILYWCNPLFFLVKRELWLIHEFLADKSAAGEDPGRSYATLILMQTMGSRSMACSNQFFHTPVKRRLHMLLKPKKKEVFMFRSKEWPAIRTALQAVVYTVIITAGLLAGCQQKEEATPAATLKDISPADIRSVTVRKESGKSYTVIHLKNGKVITLDAAQMAQAAEPPAPPPPSAGLRKAAADSNGVFTFVQQMPEFPGGEMALMKYLHDHVHYPTVARENGIQGTVVVQFIVEPDGSIRDIHPVGKSHGGGLEEETMRVVKGMPDWEPGRQDKKPVAVQYSLPVRFVLQ